MIIIDVLESPIGPLTLAERGARICMLHFGDDGPRIDETLERWYPGEAMDRRTLANLRDILERYFAGEHTVIDAVAVELNGTPFQKRVWQALRHIPSGSTISYSQLARRIGEP